MRRLIFDLLDNTYTMDHQQNCFLHTFVSYFSFDQTLFWQADPSHHCHLCMYHQIFLESKLISAESIAYLLFACLQPALIA